MVAERAESYLESIDRMQEKKQRGDRLAREANKFTNGRPAQRKRPPRENTKGPRYGMPLANIIENVELRPVSRLVYAVMTCSTGKETKSCTLSVAEICRRTGFGRRAVLGGIKELKEVGAIERVSESGQRAKATKWDVQIGGKDN